MPQCSGGGSDVGGKVLGLEWGSYEGCSTSHVLRALLPAGGVPGSALIAPNEGGGGGRSRVLSVVRSSFFPRGSNRCRSARRGML